MRKQFEVVRAYHAVPVGTIVEFDVVPRALKSHVREIKARLKTFVPQEGDANQKVPADAEKPQQPAVKK